MTLRSSSIRPCASGFTLLEMLIVLVILASVATFALPNLSRTQTKARLQSAALELAAGLRKARGIAIGSGHTASFELDTATGAFRSGNAGPVLRLPQGIGALLITTTDEERSATEGSIRFFPDGSSTGGGVRLHSEDLQIDILVDWLTGRVAIHAASVAS